MWIYREMPEKHLNKSAGSSLSLSSSSSSSPPSLSSPSSLSSCNNIAYSDNVDWREKYSSLACLGLPWQRPEQNRDFHPHSHLLKSYFMTNCGTFQHELYVLVHLWIFPVSYLFINQNVCTKCSDKITLKIATKQALTL